MRIRALLIFFGVFFTLALTAQGQTTQVSGTITDSATLPYAGARLKAQLVLAGAGVTGTPTVTVNNAQQCASGGFGSAPCQVPFQGTAGPITLDSTGSFNLTLQDNALVSPAGTQWLFSVTITPGIPPPGGFGPQSCSATVTITGASQSISGSFSCPLLQRPGSQGAAGSSGQTQVNNGGVLGATSCINFPNLASGPANVDCDSSFKGPNPYVDVRRYGVRAVNPNTTPAAVGLTASITSGSTTATISSASTFQNGDGGVIYGAGAAHSMPTPVIFSVTNKIARAGTGTFDDVNSPAGTNTVCYQIIARRLAGGLTAASTEVCTTTGQTLGSNSVALSNTTSRTNNQINFVTSAPHGLPVGCTGPGATGCPMVFVSVGLSDNAAFGGLFAVNSVPDTTHFTVLTGNDARNSGNISTPTSSFSGNVTWWNANQVTWTAITGSPYEYYIYCGASGAETLCGHSWPVNPSDSNFADGTLVWDDFGSTMMNAVKAAIPPYVPNTPPAAATSDHLVTTIASGATTTVLTLANAAGTTVTGATIRFDNAPNVLAAGLANLNLPLQFPLGGSGSYVINSPVDFSSSSFGSGGISSPVVVAPAGLWLNEPILFGQAGKLLGTTSTPTKSGGPQFGFESLPVITCKAAPCIQFVSASFGRAEGFQINGLDLNIFQDGGGGSPGVTYERIYNTTGSDPMSMAFVCRGWTNASCVAGMRKINFTVGSQSVPTASQTPGFYCDTCGNMQPIDSIFFSGRTMAFRPVSAGGTLNILWGDDQGSSTPFLTVYGKNNAGNAAASLNFGQILLDTVGMPGLSYLPSVGTTQGFVTGAGTFNPASGMPIVSGPTAGSAVWQFFGAPVRGQNMNASGLALVTTADGIFNVGNIGGYFESINNGAIKLGPNYPIYVTGDKPTNMACVVQAGGTLPVAAHTFQIIPVWQNNGLGRISDSVSCTTTSGNQQVQVNWTPPSGNPKGYVTVLDGLVQRGTTCSFPQITPGSLSSFTWSSNINCGVTAPAAETDAGGPTMFGPGTQGIFAPLSSAPNHVGNGVPCSNAELALSAGFGTTATVTAVAGTGQTCHWTITSSGTGQAANPTITDTLTNPLPNASIVCEMRMEGGTGAQTLINQTTLSATAPVFTFNGTPVAASTYIVVRRCGP